MGNHVLLGLRKKLKAFPRKHPFFLGSMAGALMGFVIIFYVFTLPIANVQLESLRDVYNGILTFNGVLLGFIALIAVFELDKLRSIGRFGLYWILLLSFLMFLLVLSTLLVFRGLLLLPAYDLGSVMPSMIFTTGAAFLLAVFVPTTFAAIMERRQEHGKRPRRS